MDRPYPISSDHTNLISEDYIHLNNCGLSTGSNPLFVTSYPNGRDDWEIFYQISGEFTAGYDGKAITLTPGDILIYPPKKPQLYEQPSGSRTLWIQFDGTAVEYILSSLGLSCGFRRGTLDSLIVESFRHLSGLSGSDYASVTVKNGTLLTLLGFLARNSVGEKANLGENLSPAIQLMREEYPRQISIAECAALCHMSESSFTHQFHDSVGVTPRDFLKDIRMEKACDLLKHTDLNVSRIATLCGYRDPLYFSRLFRKKFGVSPSDWRE